jgi:rSAM/selenodomain-associated transferase 2
MESISVIIPTLNEAPNITGTIQSVRNAGDASEIIVVDGLSSDDTRSLAKAAGATVVESEPGRARQMNAGAAEAKGEILLFLHADTKPPQGFDEHIQRAFETQNIIAGAFELQIDGQGKGLRRIEKLANWRSRTRQMPYGDQGVFLKADTFREIGGFPLMPIMEDFELMRRLKKRGRIIISPIAALTSARRWRRHGVLKTTLINQIIIWAYYFGISPTRLARWYQK